jgi:hypothetical protein
LACERAHSCVARAGFLYEQGPFHFVDQNGSDPRGDGSAVPELYLNPFRWTLSATMIFLESPAGVGFSYSNTSSDYTTDDNRTAADNVVFLQQFFKAYPEYSTQPFFISGEVSVGGVVCARSRTRSHTLTLAHTRAPRPQSYAGVYVPTLAYAVLAANAAGGPPINLQGILVGNGCTGNAQGSCSAQGTSIAVDFLFGHGLYSQALHAQIVAACPDPNNPSGACMALLQEMSNEIGDVNVYGIYSPCISGNGDVAPEESRARRIPRRVIDGFLNKGGPDACIDGIYAGRLLNNDTVRAAIHVGSLAELGRWTICSNRIFYTRIVSSVFAYYLSFLDKIRVLVYSGDVDAAVPYTDSQAWTYALGIPVKQKWRCAPRGPSPLLALPVSHLSRRPWMLDNQVAGYVTVFDRNGFTYATVKGAGHMVPETKPSAALAMFQRFLNNEPF